MLTKSEEEIMNLLWRSREPLTATGIIRMSPDKTWKDSYVHLLINSLMNKGLITVSGFVKTTKNYARSFAAAITKEEYILSLIKEQQSYSKDAVVPLITELMNELDGTKEINAVIKAAKKRLTEL